MQEEGDTVTTVIESQGDIEEVTQTTVTIEHKASGDVLDGDTGIVTSKYEGSADKDWGGRRQHLFPFCLYGCCFWISCNGNRW